VHGVEWDGRLYLSSPPSLDLALIEREIAPDQIAVLLMSLAALPAPEGAERCMRRRGR
jgi:hypothetical protein